MTVVNNIVLHVAKRADHKKFSSQERNGGCVWWWAVTRPNAVRISQ